MGTDTDLEVWFSDPIGKIRVTAPPGGDTFTVQEAKEFRDKLTDVIETAQSDSNGGENHE